MHWIDPDSLPETVGRVDLFLVNPHGEVDGMMLADGTEVHLPPHMGPDIVRALRPGSVVRLRGVRPRAADLLAAVAFETEQGTRYVDQGPPKHDPKHHRPKHARPGHEDAAVPPEKPVDLAGTVRRTLHGPKGETRGLLLDDGRSGRFPPHAADDLRPLLQAGAAIVLRGKRVVTPHGTVVAVQEIGPAGEPLRPIAAKPHKPKAPKESAHKDKPAKDGPPKDRHGGKPHRPH